MLKSFTNITHWYQILNVRIDKWLWSARFYKTRALAKKHIESGKVTINGQKVKPSRAVQIQDHLVIKKGELMWKVEVVQLIDKRVSAKLAAETYIEEQESIDSRKNTIEQNKMVYSSAPRPTKHPNKKDRRDLIKIKKSGF